MTFSTLKPKALHKNIAQLLSITEGERPMLAQMAHQYLEILSPTCSILLSLNCLSPRDCHGCSYRAVFTSPLTLLLDTLFTQAVVAIVSQHKAIVASTAVIPRNVETLVDTAPIEVVVTFINV